MGLVNAYCSVAQVLAELRNAGTDSEGDPDAELAAAIVLAINQASRFIDEYKGRDYFFHDHSTSPLKLSKYSEGVFYRDAIFLPYKPVLTLTAVAVDGVAWVAEEDYVEQEGGRLYSIDGQWPLLTPPSYVEVTGTFGHILDWQPDTAVAVGARVLNNGKIYVADTAGTTASSGGPATTATNITDGTARWDYVEAATTKTAVPAHIQKAAILIAAALSGENRKDAIGLDGQKQTLIDKALPKTALDLLGARRVGP